MEVVILSGAEDDLFSTWQSLEELVPGLGNRFDLSIKSALERLAMHPESAPGQFRLRINVNQKTGAFRGSLTAAGKKIPISGIIRPGERKGLGVAGETGLDGAVELQALLVAILTKGRCSLRKPRGNRYRRRRTSMSTDVRSNVAVPGSGTAVAFTCMRGVFRFGVQFPTLLPM